VSRTVLVTGGTGLTGANVVRLLRQRGDSVRCLIRGSADAQPLADLGAELSIGDVTDAASVKNAADGCDGIIHSAALLGGASQDLADFVAVNQVGTTHVLDAGAAHGIRVVALSTSTFFDTSGGVSLEDAPVAANQGEDPYNTTKLAAFLECVQRADAGQDVMTGHPGAIYGPSPVVSRALHWTSFNKLLLSALRGRVESYLRFPVSWVLASDFAWGSIAALDRGTPGGRYIFDGRREDVTSMAEGCTRICELAGLVHRTQDVLPSDDPELLKTFGPTLLAISRKAVAAESTLLDPSRRPPASRTASTLGYAPTSLDDGFTQTIAWLRAEGKV
jgi:dihydroflavonol-4-reductase